MLRLGSVGFDVENLQKLLNKYFGKDPLKADGQFGPKTKYYVEQFQRKAGLVADGIAGPQTLEALRSSPNPNPAPLPSSSDHPPFAMVLQEKMRERGTYAKGSPLGAIVHFTAGHDGAKKTILGGIKDGYTYWCIQRDGLLVCAHRYNRWGHHAGESRWKNLKGGVSDDLIGIEINAYGLVSPIKGKPGRFLTWFKLEIGEDEVRYTPGRDNQAPGYYHVFTAAQEETLIKTLLWLKSKNPAVFDFDLVLGHDEVSGKQGLGYWRKTDPGSALSMTMPELRAELKRRWAAQV